MLKLKLQYFGHLMWRTDSLEKTLMQERLKAGGEGDDRGWDDWMTLPTQWTWVWANSGSWHGQGGLACCSPWGREELDTTEWLHFHFSLSCTGEGNGSPLHYSCLENPRDGSLVGCHLWVAQSRTRLVCLSSSSNSRATELNWMFSSSAPPPGWEEEFSCPFVVKLGPQITVLYVCGEHVLGIINVLSSLDSMWVSCNHCFTVWGHVPCFCCKVLLLHKPAWFCG